MYTFHEDKIGITIIEKKNSTSGYYTIFFGEHNDGIGTCYDVGALDLRTGALTRRHYTELELAGQYWEQFKSDMTGEGEHGEQEPGDELTIIPPNHVN